MDLAAAATFRMANEAQTDQMCTAALYLSVRHRFLLLTFRREELSLKPKTNCSSRLPPCLPP
jgi:hypothetical protein